MPLDLPFRVVSKYSHALFGFVTKHACERQTEGQTDRRTDGRTDGQTDKITTPYTALE